MLGYDERPGQLIEVGRRLRRRRLTRAARLVHLEDEARPARGIHRRSPRLVSINSATIRAMGTLTPYRRTILFVAYTISKGSGDGRRLAAGARLRAAGRFW